MARDRTNWSEIKHEYITSLKSMATLAKEFNVNIKNLGTIAKKEEWVMLRKEYKKNLEEKTLEKVVEKLSEERAEVTIDFLSMLSTLTNKANTALSELNVDINAFGREFKSNSIITRKLKEIAIVIEKAQKCYRIEQGLMSKYEEENINIQKAKMGMIEESNQDDGFIDALKAEVKNVWSGEDEENI